MRTILHIDINSCFASCEQQDNPDLRGKPVGVLQDSGKRSVVIGSSREAKRFGVETGMPIWEAKRLCPGLIAVPADFKRYAHYSRLFRKVCFDYSDRVEVFSIDELFMDVTETKQLFSGKSRDLLQTRPDPGIDGEALVVAYELKRRLKHEVGDYLTVSIGIAPNKMLAKLASGSQKPDGLVVVTPEHRLEFLDTHPLWHICGIGTRIERRLKRMGIYTIRQLRQTPKEYLVREFGVLGQIYWNWGHGEDTDPVSLAWELDPDKSYGNQMTLPNDTKDEKETLQVLLWLSWQVAARLRDHRAAGRTVHLGLRRGETWARGQHSMSLCTTAYDIYRTAKFLYYHKLCWHGPIRFAALSVGNLSPLSPTPLSLLPKQAKQLKMAEAWDKVAERYGAFYLRPASLLGKQLKETYLNGFTRKF